MNRNIIHKLFFSLPVIIAFLGIMTGMTSCDDETEVLSPSYGYVQFKVRKNSSLKEEAASRSNELDYLGQAEKLKVVILSNGNEIQQTLPLMAYNSENAEYGLQSSKLKLMAGDYDILGFYLYDKLDKEIYSGTSNDMHTLTIVSGGISEYVLGADVVSRGQVSFRVVKDIANSMSRAIDDTYNFSAIRCVSFKVKNVFTNEVTPIEKLQVKYTEGFRKVAQENGDSVSIRTSFCETDSLIWLKSGSYQVVDYTTYGDRKGSAVLEHTKITASKTFVVKDNKITREAEIPVQMSVTSENIKDYIALKAIWEALDGPKWRYVGEVENPGTNWNFDKDIDMWGDQPGVGLDNDGRVVTLSLDGMGISGIVPDEIGQLTKLQILSFGSHSEQVGGHLFADVKANMTAEEKLNMRYDYEKHFLTHDFRECLSPIWQQTINMDPNEKPIVKSRISPKEIVFGDCTNNLQGISKAIMRLTDLEQFYIANSPFTIDENGNGLFKEIASDHPFAKEDLSWEKMDKLVDMEIYNCKNMKSLPMEMLTSLPELQLLNIACNRGISAKTLKDNWTTFNEGNSGAKLQILYMGFNNLVEFPDNVAKMKLLGMLDCTSNRIRKLVPFGKDIQLSKLFLSFNEIEEIPVDANGYFFGYNDMEGFSCSNNRLKKVPNIFNAKSVYVMGSVDYSNNQISGFADGDNFNGINTGQLNLANNQLTEFPSILFKTGSPINYLVLSGNKIKEIKKGAMNGNRTYMLTALDLSYNKLTKLPEDFTARLVPYMSGLELSGNSFSEFPMHVIGLPALERLFIRYQRDADGNRCLREWPTGISSNPALVFFCIGGNDLRKIDDKISPFIRFFEIKDNPNISIDLSTVCAAIQAGIYNLVYDKTQDIRGCDILDLEK